MNLTNQFFKRSLSFAFFALLFVLPSSFATHIVGGELNYKHISGDQYELNLVLFRDCYHGDALAPFDSPASIGLFSGSDNILLEEFLIPLSAINDTLTPIPSDSCFIIPDIVCVHTTTYSKVVTLPYRADGYVLAYQRCCRNETLTNIVDPLNTGASYHVEISEEALAEHNSGPEYKEWPPLFICVNEHLVWDHSAVDVDGDSLVYTLCKPFGGGSDLDNMPQPPHNPPYDNITWAAPYDTENMLGTGPNALRIDSETGIMTAFPTIVGQFLVGVCLEEYRDGVKISTIYRDFQYNVGQCSKITSIIGNEDVQCEDLTLDFINDSKEASRWLWLFGDPTDPDASFDGFEPSHTYPDTGRYTITLIAQPGNQCVDTSSLEIYLKNSTLFADFEYLFLDCGDSTIVTINNLSYDTYSTIEEYAWTLEDSDGNTISTSDLENPVFAVDESESYTLSVDVIVDDGCSTLVSKDFTVDDNVGGVKDTFLICPGTSINLNENPFTGANVTYSWSPADGLDNATIGNPLATPASTTLYTLSINDSNSGCIGGFGVLVQVQEDNAIIIESDTTICSNSILLHAETTGISTYEWSSDDDGILGSGSDITVDVDGTETFTLNTVDQNGCAFSDEITVTTSPLYLEPDFDFTVVSCGDDVTVSFTDLTTHPSGVVSTWDWKFGNLATTSLQNPTVTFTTTGSVEVTLIISNNDGCSETIVKTIELDPYIMDVTHLEPVVSNCSYAPMELNPDGNPSYEYHWTPATGLDDANAMNPMASPGITTTYTVIVIDPATDCQVSRDVIYQLPDSPLDASFDWSYSSCLNDVSIEFNHSASYSDGEIITWEWLLNGVSVELGQIATFLINSNQYNEVTLIVTADDGCTHSVTEEIDVSKLDLFVPDGDLFLCKGESMILNPNGNDSYVYTWAPEENITAIDIASPTVTPSETTTYTVHAEIAGTGCTADATYKVVVPVEFVKPDFDYTFDNCDNPIELSFENKTEYADANIVDYAWSFDPMGTMIFDENSKLIVTEEGTVTVKLSAEGEDGCIGEIEKEIVIDFFGTGSIKDSILVCQGESIELNPGGDETLTYDWSPSETLDNAISYNPLASPTETTIYTVNVSNESNTECDQDVSIKVEVPTYIAQFNLSANYQSSCGEGLSSFEIHNLTTMSDGSDIIKWEWFMNGTSISTKEVPDILYGISPDLEFVLEITTKDGCTYRETMNDVDKKNINSEGSIRDTLYICLGEEICLNPDNIKASSYLWNGGDLVNDTQVNPCVTPQANTLYTGLLEDYQESNLCSFTWERFVVVRDLPKVNIEKPTGCIHEEGSITITPVDPSQPITYTWSPENVIKTGQGTPTITFDIESDMTFTLLIENKFGCSITEEIIVDITDFEDYKIEADDTFIESGDSTVLHVVGKDDFKYIWIPGDNISDPTSADPTVYPTDTTEYVVQITDADGCQGLATFTLYVGHYSECKEPYVFIPNAFTPNGDKMNDKLLVNGLDILEMHLVVFDRWGQKVYESTDQSEGWDGTYKGKALPPDVYGFYLTVTCTDDDTFVKQGNISLIR